MSVWNSLAQPEVVPIQLAAEQTELILKVSCEKNRGVNLTSAATQPLVVFCKAHSYRYSQIAENQWEL